MLSSITSLCERLPESGSGGTPAGCRLVLNAMQGCPATQAYQDDLSVSPGRLRDPADPVVDWDQVRHLLSLTDLGPCRLYSPGRIESVSSTPSARGQQIRFPALRSGAICESFGVCEWAQIALCTNSVLMPSLFRSSGNHADGTRIGDDHPDEALVDPVAFVNKRRGRGFLDCA